MSSKGKVTKEEALEYHVGGKIAINVKTRCDSARDLSMAYTPGVAHPCLEIEKDNELAYTYTNKGNLVAVITDGTAVLGLGDIGAVAGKPVMEGKSVLFKKFADVDAFDIELDEKDTDKIIAICKALAPTFGGINLEDIKAPKCFEIEQKLQACVNIPVMHDDQHGTAMITSAGLINALEISGKKIEEMKIVVSGAGAAGIACAKMYKLLGAKNIVMIDSKGVIHKGRTDLNAYKAEFALETSDRTLEDAMKGSDMFLGLSAPGVVTAEMVKSMNPHPIIFALANPTPEILPEEVHAVRDDVMMGTGRSDYPNQVNNVLGFPFIFRGALDVKATKVTEGMKMAAAVALAQLAKEDVPAYVKAAYNGEELKFGYNYIIPKPFDRRVLVWVSVAVAEAAIKDGVARVENFDLNAYKAKLQAIIDAEQK
ncbi:MULTISPECIES: malic enzyme-like NAD(P)-binding protein [Sulfurospirillum]|uniref:malic enzyme-like NAD(P)-binding protein n=1 Tax=Sulfurospirillum TaxID=57665 RepID=UPI000A703290|nr:malic enzyme-like NAD(P)-binding protein [Sulfurospirillum cavolei]MCP3652984.1 malate dehydrogenase [Sulfurospirillum sp. DNRA8]MCR1811835.1 malate dehydrogenase [Sulfurospirillum sp. DNRA8]MDY0265692.1 malic enzyme-like NAD(P)-binding protein [Sulfurospirillum cavolei]